MLSLACLRNFLQRVRSPLTVAGIFASRLYLFFVWRYLIRLRKCLADGIMYPVWFSLPIRHSKLFVGQR